MDYQDKNASINLFPLLAMSIDHKGYTDKPKFTIFAKLRFNLEKQILLYKVSPCNTLKKNKAIFMKNYCFTLLGLKYKVLLV